MKRVQAQRRIRKITLLEMSLLIWYGNIVIGTYITIQDPVTWIVDCVLCRPDTGEEPVQYLLKGNPRLRWSLFCQQLWIILCDLNHRHPSHIMWFFLQYSVGGGFSKNRWIHVLMIWKMNGHHNGWLHSLIYASNCDICTCPMCVS